jgi:ribose 5-phosphate isomerase A
VAHNQQTPLIVARHALDLVQDGMVVGLGSGRAATAFITALGERVQAGLQVRGVPTSQATADLAGTLGIPLVGLDQVEQIDLTVDGADEVDPQLNLIKGYGRALVREKIVAAASRRLVILVGADKLVPKLGSRGKLPVEVLPFARPFCSRKLREFGCDPVPYEIDGRLYLTDNGNHILDCRIGPIDAPRVLEEAVRAIPGVVGTGLFLDMADTVCVQDGTKVQFLRRGGPPPNG